MAPFTRLLLILLFLAYVPAQAAQLPADEAPDPGAGAEAARLMEASFADAAAQPAAAQVAASDRRLAALDRDARALGAPDAAAIEALDRAYTAELRARDAVLRGVTRLLGPAGGPVASGTVVSLEHPIFEPATVKLGMRDPQAFLAAAGGGVYLLRPFEPDLTVVLVVHGMNGCPRDFREIIGALDPARYQVWVAYYPSGEPIDAAAKLVGNAAAALLARYPPKQMAVITHSLGGLVWRARALPGADAGAAATDPHVQAIYTLCGFHQGVHFMPLPAVRLACHILYRFLPPYIDDILQGSAFLDRLAQAPPPPGVRRTAGGFGHNHLWYRTLIGSFIPGPDDGLVPLSSTDWPGAVEHRTYDQDHVTMLEAPAVLAQLKAWLALDLH